MKRYLKSIDAWKGVGRVSGITLVWGWPDGRPDEEETVYLEELSWEIAALFPHLLGLSEAVKKLVVAGKYRREEPEGRSGR